MLFIVCMEDTLKIMDKERFSCPNYTIQKTKVQFHSKALMDFIHDLNSIMSQIQFTLTLPFTFHKNCPSIRKLMECDIKNKIKMNSNQNLLMCISN